MLAVEAASALQARAHEFVVGLPPAHLLGLLLLAPLGGAVLHLLLLRAQFLLRRLFFLVVAAPAISASSRERRPLWPREMQRRTAIMVSHCRIDCDFELLLSRSVDLGPGLSLADEAAERAALQLQRVAAREGEIARIGLAVLGIVDLPRPFVGAGRLHAEHDLHADQRPAALRRIGIVLVGLRLAGVRIVRLLQPDDGAAQRAAAIRDADARVAALGQPDAGRIGRERALGARQRKQRDGREKVSSHVNAPRVLPPPALLHTILGGEKAGKSLAAPPARMRTRRERASVSPSIVVIGGRNPHG